ncbi:hypothetical protein CLF_108674 [Clonorchis sinensis]|uniref:Uncharacterized protein n=1 Tax=Clonorchis sinensis TaxID=79923 RepID=G7YID9_CLOSI|nr:hypothetical protein CLF_108674 [Clonorchis sinensis]
MFKTDFSKSEDGWKVRLLPRKLGTPKHGWYTSFLIPKLPCGLSFDETARILSHIFGNHISLFIIRCQCLRLVKKVGNLITFAGVVNRACQRFKLSSVTDNQSKCFIFVSGSIRLSHLTRPLIRIEQDAEMTLHSLTAKC